MRKLVAFLLAVTLLTTLSLPALSEGDNMYLYPGTMLLGPMEYSADEWLASDYSRAMLAVVFALEIYIKNQDNSALRTAIANGVDEGEVFVALGQDGFLYVMFRDTEQVVCATYILANDLILVGIQKPNSSQSLEDLMKGCVDDGILAEYYAVSQIDLAAAISDLPEMLGE
ncbi:MAG: hypothetical protein ACI4ML_01205 [Aristaeellaceae bacterium]